MKRKVTISMMKYYFNIFNVEYFNNELLLDEIKLSSVKKYIGSTSRLRLRNGFRYVLTFNKDIVMDEKYWMNVLLHEMAHLYCFQEYTENIGHGREWLNVVNDLNIQTEGEYGLISATPTFPYEFAPSRAKTFVLFNNGKYDCLMNYTRNSILVAKLMARPNTEVVTFKSRDSLLCTLSSTRASLKSYTCYNVSDESKTAVHFRNVVKNNMNVLEKLKIEKS